MSSETVIQCPFCGKETITILRIPFVSKTVTSKCRAGGRVKKIQKGRDDVLSGCSECGKTKKEVIARLDNKEEISHEDRLKRLLESGLPTKIET
ncbi:hypothetical protein KKC60_03980 [Patescibacteria group bacterium]|nr:hypothetical protein [Patescibacteria group bacterium]